MFDRYVGLERDWAISYICFCIQFVTMCIITYLITISRGTTHQLESIGIFTSSLKYWIPGTHVFITFIK